MARFGDMKTLQNFGAGQNAEEGLTNLRLPDIRDRSLDLGKRLGDRIVPRLTGLCAPLGRSRRSGYLQTASVLYRTGRRCGGPGFVRANGLR